MLRAPWRVVAGRLWSATCRHLQVTAPLAAAANIPCGYFGRACEQHMSTAASQRPGRPPPLRRSRHFRLVNRSAIRRRSSSEKAVVIRAASALPLPASSASTSGERASERIVPRRDTDHPELLVPHPGACGLERDHAAALGAHPRPIFFRRGGSRCSRTISAIRFRARTHSGIPEWPRPGVFRCRRPPPQPFEQVPPKLRPAAAPLRIPNAGGRSPGGLRLRPRRAWRG